MLLDKTKYYKSISVLIAGIFLFNTTIGYALSPESRLTRPQFKESYFERYMVLSHEAANKFIGEYLQNLLSTNDKAKINIEELSQGVLRHRTDEKENILIVGIPDLLKKIGQPGHIGLSKWNNRPTVYIDIQYFYDQAVLEDVLEHEKDEIANWRAKARELNIDFGKMREFRTTEKGQRFAAKSHEKSKSLDRFREKLKKHHEDEKSPYYLDFDSEDGIYERYKEHGLDEDDKTDSNIAASSRENTGPKPEVGNISRILIVSSKEHTREWLSMFLQYASGVESLVCATDYEAALRIIEESPQPFTIVFADDRIADEVGLELYRKIRNLSDKARANTHFVLLDPFLAYTSLNYYDMLEKLAQRDPFFQSLEDYAQPQTLAAFISSLTGKEIKAKELAHSASLFHGRQRECSEVTEKMHMAPSLELPYKCIFAVSERKRNIKGITDLLKIRMGKKSGMLETFERVDPLINALKREPCDLIVIDCAACGELGTGLPELIKRIRTVEEECEKEKVPILLYNANEKQMYEYGKGNSIERREYALDATLAPDVFNYTLTAISALERIRKNKELSLLPEFTENEDNLALVLACTSPVLNSTLSLDKGDMPNMGVVCSPSFNNLNNIEAGIIAHGVKFIRSSVEIPENIKSDLLTLYCSNEAFIVRLFDRAREVRVIASKYNLDDVLKTVNEIWSAFAKHGVLSLIDELHVLETNSEPAFVQKKSALFAALSLGQKKALLQFSDQSKEEGLVVPSDFSERYNPSLNPLRVEHFNALALSIVAASLRQQHGHEKATGHIQHMRNFSDLISRYLRTRFKFLSEHRVVGRLTREQSIVASSIALKTVGEKLKALQRQLLNEGSTHHGAIMRRVTRKDIEKVLERKDIRSKLERDLRQIERIVSDHRMKKIDGFLSELEERTGINKADIIKRIKAAKDDLLGFNTPIRQFPAIVNALDCYGLGLGTDDYLAYAKELLETLPPALRQEYLFHEALCHYFPEKAGHQIARRIQMMLFPDNYKDVTPRVGDENPELTGQLTLALYKFIEFGLDTATATKKKLTKAPSYKFGLDAKGMGSEYIILRKDMLNIHADWALDQTVLGRLRLAETIGERIKILLEESGSSYEEMAQHTGVRKLQLERWIEKRTSVYPQYIKKLAAFFAIDPSLIIEGKTTWQALTDQTKNCGQRVELLRIAAGKAIYDFKPTGIPAPVFSMWKNRPYYPVEHPYLKAFCGHVEVGWKDPAMLLSGKPLLNALIDAANDAVLHAKRMRDSGKLEAALKDRICMAQARKDLLLLDAEENGNTEGVHKLIAAFRLKLLNADIGKTKGAVIQEISEETGISIQQIRKPFNGTNIGNDSVRQAISQYFDISESLIFDGEPLESDINKLVGMKFVRVPITQTSYSKRIQFVLAFINKNSESLLKPSPELEEVLARHGVKIVIAKRSGRKGTTAALVDAFVEEKPKPEEPKETHKPKPSAKEVRAAEDVSDLHQALLNEVKRLRREGGRAMTHKDYLDALSLFHRAFDIAEAALAQAENKGYAASLSRLMAALQSRIASAEKLCSAEDRRRADKERETANREFRQGIADKEIAHQNEGWAATLSLLDEAAQERKLKALKEKAAKEVQPQRVKLRNTSQRIREAMRLSLKNASNRIHIVGQRMREFGSSIEEVKRQRERDALAGRNKDTRQEDAILLINAAITALKNLMETERFEGIKDAGLLPSVRNAYFEGANFKETYGDDAEIDLFFEELSETIELANTRREGWIRREEERSQALASITKKPRELARRIESARKKLASGTALSTRESQACLEASFAAMRDSLSQKIGAVDGNLPRSLEDMMQHLQEIQEALQILFPEEKQRGETSPNTGSPAGLLEYLRDNTELLREALNKNGITLRKVNKTRFKPKTDKQYKDKTKKLEFQILIDLGIFEPIKGDPYDCRFTEMMKGKDLNYTESLINRIIDIRYRVGKRGDKPLYRYDFRKEAPAALKTVYELVKMAALEHISVTSKETKTLWHIIDEDLLAFSQKSLITEINKTFRNSKAPERIRIVRGNEIAGTIAEISGRDSSAAFDVGLSNANLISKLPDDVKMLVFKRSGGDFEHLEGIIAALNALHLPKEKKIGALLRIYRILHNGKEYKLKIPAHVMAALLDDSKAFAQRFIFDLPRTAVTNYDEKRKLNERLLKILLSA